MTSFKEAIQLMIDNNEFAKIAQDNPRRRGRALGFRKKLLEAIEEFGSLENVPTLVILHMFAKAEPVATSIVCYMMMDKEDEEDAEGIQLQGENDHRVLAAEGQAAEAR